jgi:hypothetical protein
MSRSFKRSAYVGNAQGSDKKDKRLANRAHRRAGRVALVMGRLAPVLREVSNPWSFKKDGKRRFDAVKYPEGLRK